MEKENIITINQAHEETDFNWAIKRYLSDSNIDEKIIGVRFPWNGYIENENISEILLKTTELFNEFSKTEFFNSLSYEPQLNDIFLFKIRNFASYYWIEFIYTGKNWSMLNQNFNNKNDSKVLFHGTDFSYDFIVSPINNEILMQSFAHPKLNKMGLEKYDYKLPINVNNSEEFEKSNYNFYFKYSDGLREDLRLRHIDLLMDGEFDYYLTVKNLDGLKSFDNKLNFILEGKIPNPIIFQLIKIVNENNHFTSYGESVYDASHISFIFRVDNKIYKSHIEGHYSFLENKDVEFQNLKNLEKLITDWVDKIVEFQKQN